MCSGTRIMHTPVAMVCMMFHTFISAYCTYFSKEKCLYLFYSLTLISLQLCYKTNRRLSFWRWDSQLSVSSFLAIVLHAHTGLGICSPALQGVLHFLCNLQPAAAFWWCFCGEMWSGFTSTTTEHASLPWGQESLTYCAHCHCGHHEVNFKWLNMWFTLQIILSCTNAVMIPR